ncbi:MAG TPA: hypothetical protein VIG33_18355 [Pseudobdellovibrionaceae bacterium]
MNHLHFVSFLETLAQGNDPKNIALNASVKKQLSEMDIGVGIFNPNSEQIEGFMGSSIETIQPFVFAAFDQKGPEVTTPEEELSLPFKNTWIETFDHSLFREVVHGSLETDGRGGIFITPLHSEEMKVSEIVKGRRVRITMMRDMVGALIIEPDEPKNPYQAVMYQETRLLAVHPDDQGEDLFQAAIKRYGNKAVIVENYAGSLYHSMAEGSYSSLGPEGRLYRAAQYLLTTMRKSSTQAGTVRVDARAKVGTGQNRRLMKIKNLVIVVPKKQREGLENLIGSSKEIDWSHRWDVMGHWRKVGGIGKDRNGDYSVKGYTWVISHVKGPDEQPYIRKTRFVQDDDETE